MSTVMSGSEESIKESLSLQGVPAQQGTLAPSASGCLMAAGRLLRREIPDPQQLGSCSPHCSVFKGISEHASVSPLVSSEASGSLWLDEPTGPAAEGSGGSGEQPGEHRDSG